MTRRKSPVPQGLFIGTDSIYNHWTSDGGHAMSKYTIIDADTHVTETPDLWTSRAPARMRDSVPRIETDGDGSVRWVVGNSRGLASVGLTATAGVGSFKNPPKTYEEMHPGAYDAKARLKY